MQAWADCDTASRRLDSDCDAVPWWLDSVVRCVGCDATEAVMAQSRLCCLRGAATCRVIHDAPPLWSRPWPSLKFAG